MNRSSQAPLALAFCTSLATVSAGAQVVELRPDNPVSYSRFGWSLSQVPDLDGDGIADVVVGAPDNAAENGRGRAYVFSGRTGECLKELLAPEPRGEFDHFGSSVMGLEDINGDGLGDFVVGAPSQPATTGGGGVAHVYSGHDSSLLHSLDFGGGGLGDGASLVPDCDNDGFDDVVLRAPVAIDGTGLGRAVLVSPRAAHQLWVFAAPSGSGATAFPGSVSGVPDVDGDSLGDVLIGSPTDAINGVPNAGRVLVYSGSTGSLYLTLQSHEPTRPIGFGGRVSGCIDMNADGRGEIIVCNPMESLAGMPVRSGVAHVLCGRTGEQLLQLVSPTPQIGPSFGRSVCSVSDRDGDGVADIVVGSPFHGIDNVVDAGAVFVFSGRTGVAIEVLRSPNPQMSGKFGYAVSAMNDINGDGLNEVLVGAITESSKGGRDGAGYIFMSCRVDWDQSGDVNSSDVFLYLADFFHGDGRADFNHDARINSQDFLSFVILFFAGC